jgi:hypothetical protein
MTVHSLFAGLLTGNRSAGQQGWAADATAIAADGGSDNGSYVTFDHFAQPL